MFGMSFTEILTILIIAIIFVGPEKLPKVAVDIAKIFKRFKGAVAEAKTAIDDEINMAELKSQAQKYKAQIEHDTIKAKAGISQLADLNLDLDMNLKNDNTNTKKDKTNISNKNQNLETTTQKEA